MKTILMMATRVTTTNPPPPLQLRARDDDYDDKNSYADSTGQTDESKRDNIAPVENYDDASYVDYISYNDEVDNGYVAAVMAMQSKEESVVVVDGFQAGHGYHSFRLFDDERSNVYHWQDTELHKRTGKWHGGLCGMVWRALYRKKLVRP